MLTNVQGLKQTSVMPTPCAPTRKDPMFAAALKVTREMEETAQVFMNLYVVKLTSKPKNCVSGIKTEGFASVTRKSRCVGDGTFLAISRVRKTIVKTSVQT